MRPVEARRTLDRDERGEPTGAVGAVGAAGVLGGTAGVAAPAQTAAPAGGGAWAAQAAQQVAEVIAMRADGHGTHEATLSLAAALGAGSVTVQSLGQKRLRLRVSAKDADVRAQTLAGSLRDRGFTIEGIDATELGA